MAFQTGVTMKILVNQYDLTGYFRKMDLDAVTSMYDTTVFGSTSKAFIPGIKSGTIAVEGLFEGVATANAPDNVFSAIEASATVPLVSIAPAGLTVGNRVYLLQAHEHNHNVAAVIDDLIMNSAEFTDNDGYDFGLSLHALTAEISFPVNGTSINNGAATNNGGVGFLHVTAIAGGAPNIVYKIQHSTNDSTWVDLIQFSAVTSNLATTGYQRTVVAAGTQVRQYLRMTATEGGTTSSIVGAVSFARR